MTELYAHKTYGYGATGSRWTLLEVRRGKGIEPFVDSVPYDESRLGGQLQRVSELGDVAEAFAIYHHQGSEEVHIYRAKIQENGSILFPKIEESHQTARVEGPLKALLKFMEKSKLGQAFPYVAVPELEGILQG